MELEQDDIELKEDDVIELPDSELEEQGQEEPANEIEESSEDDKNLLKKGVNFERKRRKEAEKKAKELEAKLQELQSKQEPENEKSTLDILKESGVDENIALSIAKAIDKKQDNSKTEKELEELKFKIALSEKSKEEGFEDIAEYSEDIKNLMTKGLTIEQAYYASSYSKPSINTKSEIQKAVEVKMQNNQARKEILGGLVENAGAAIGSSNEKGQKATAEEVAIAKMAGLSVDEYITLKKTDNVKDYQEYSNKKIRK